jgi:folate-binding protein YgfZ
MEPGWLEYLASAGAQVVDGGVAGFGDLSAERAAAATGSVLAPLTGFSVLAVAGEDAERFLHGQLSCDVEGLAADRSTYGSYNTAKGRMLASFLLWRAEDGFRMLLSRSIAPGVQKRLQMFVLRARVGIASRDAEDVLLGASGPDAAAAVARACGPAPANRHDVSAWPGGKVLRVPGGRFVITVDASRAVDTWRALSASLRAVGAPCWDWLDIANGIPFVTAATQDQLVPQMANLELIGAVNFKKGCYPGQEVVARTQYLGKLKRRMYLAHLGIETPPASGLSLYSEDTGDQANGLILAAAPGPHGGVDCLAVVQSASMAGSRVHLGALDGPPLEFRPLPYALE